MTKDELWALEWDHKSNSIHVQPVNWMTARNVSSFKENSEPAARYVPLFIGTRAEVEAEADRVRSVLVAREEERRA